MAPSKVALILGAGPNIGKGLATSFASAGYSIALVSRNPSSPNTVDSEGYLRIKADLSKPSDIAAAFSAVKTQFGIAPKTVVYNAAQVSPLPDASNLFSLSVETFNSDLQIMISSAYAAAQEAVKAWTEGGIEDGRFIYTGNATNKIVIPAAALATLGVGKSGSYYWVSLADALFKPKGHR
jgi:NAD(P)-dependent dehydrogenase (short-subunit alcohol dehydrogenase family)